MFGIHWNDVDHERIDLDLSIINLDGEKFGWDGSYRDTDRTILFSGDMTSAPKPDGATELFYVQRQLQATFLLNVNYFNHSEYIEVPFSIMVAKEKLDNLEQNYMINPNNIVAVTNSKMREKQKVLGIIDITADGCKFYFSEFNIGRSITAHSNEYTKNSIKYLVSSYTNSISFNDILVKAGAIISNDKGECDIDLSLEKLEKDTIINLIKEE
jgi:hypothetical protein